MGHSVEDNLTSNNDLVIAKEGRLQRPMRISGLYITQFRQILLRHGLFVLLLALLCFARPGAVESLNWGLTGAKENALSYLLIAGTLFLFFIIFANVGD